ncbi:MAG: acyl-CoA dehydrogenase family protein [Marinobacter sp.]
MDLKLSSEYDAFRTEVRYFLDEHKHSAPSEDDVVLKSSQRMAWQQLLLAHGYIARTIPKEYGGFGEAPDILKARIITEEFERAGVPVRVRVANRQGVNMLVPTLLEFGSEEQKGRWIPPTLRGELIWCQGYSEPNAGSDLASLQTKAIIENGHYVINGQKIWTSEARQADMIFCLVRTEADMPKHKGISFLIFPMDLPGIDVRPLQTMTGTSSFNEVFFTDVRVPVDQIVQQPGEGWRVANATLKHERGTLGGADVAGSRIQKIIDMMHRETVAGERLIENAVFRDRLIRLQVRVQTMKLHGLRLLTHELKNEDPGLAQLVVKLQGCELSHQLAALAIDVMGELGILYDDSPHLRDGGRWQYDYMFDLGLIIGGGTAQVQKNIIAERGLGMPREPVLVRN